MWQLLQCLYEGVVSVFLQRPLVLVHTFAVIAVVLFCRVLSHVEGSLVYLLGNTLLMASLAYLLISMALKYGNVNVYPQW